MCYQLIWLGLCYHINNNFKHIAPKGPKQVCKTHHRSNISDRVHFLLSNTSLYCGVCRGVD